MTRKDLLGILYVSIVVIVWGSIGSIIDYPLLNKEIYQAGSIGQLATFTISGFLITVISIYLYKKIISKYLDEN